MSFNPISTLSSQQQLTLVLWKICEQQKKIKQQELVIKILVAALERLTNGSAIGRGGSPGCFGTMGAPSPTLSLSSQSPPAPPQQEPLLQAAASISPSASSTSSSSSAGAQPPAPARSKAAVSPEILAARMAERVASFSGIAPSASLSSSSSSGQYQKIRKIPFSSRTAAGPALCPLPSASSYSSSSSHEAEQVFRETELLPNFTGVFYCNRKRLICPYDKERFWYVATMRKEIAEALLQGNYIFNQGRACKILGVEVCSARPVLDAGSSGEVRLRIEPASIETASYNLIDCGNTDVDLSECHPLVGEESFAEQYPYTEQYPYAFVQSVTLDARGANFFLLHNPRYNREVDEWSGNLVSAIQGEDQSIQGFKVESQKLRFNQRSLSPLGFVRIPKKEGEALQFLLDLLGSFPSERMVVKTASGRTDIPFVHSFNLGY